MKHGLCLIWPRGVHVPVDHRYPIEFYSSERSTDFALFRFIRFHPIPCFISMNLNDFLKDTFRIIVLFDEISSGIGQI